MNRFREIRNVVVATKGGFDMAECLLLRRPAKCDRLDLQPAPWTDDLDRGPFAGAVFVRRIVQEHIRRMSIDDEARAERPGALREHLCELLRRRDDGNDPATVTVHHGADLLSLTASSSCRGSTSC